MGFGRTNFHKTHGTLSLLFYEKDVCTKLAITFYDKQMQMNKLRFVSLNEPSYTKLRRYNYILSFIHLSSLCGISLLATSKWPVYVTQESKVWMPINASSTESCDKTPCMVTAIANSAFQLHVEDLVVAFHIPAVISHFYAAEAPHLAYAHIDSNPPRVPHRWVEYSVSASIMMICILILTGTTDLWSLVFAFTMSAGTQAMGYIGEFYPKRWFFFCVGSLLMIPPWVTVYYTFYDSLSRAVNSVPAFVYYVVWSLFLMFSSFAVVNACQRLNKITAIGAEKCYMILSLLAKTGLAWQIFFGALSREKMSLVAYNPG